MMMTTMKALVERQRKIDKNFATHRNYKSIPIGSTVMRGDWIPWTHGTIIDKGVHSYND